MNENLPSSEDVRRVFNRTAYSLWDVQQALSALTFLLEECDYSASYSRVELRKFRCYEASLIVSLARPFVKSRGATTLSLRRIGLRLDDGDRRLLERVIELRHKLIAHSDEDQMHFRTELLEMGEDTLPLPYLVFDEGLLLNELELRRLENILRTLRHSIYGYLFQLSRSTPDLFGQYLRPESEL